MKKFVPVLCLAALTLTACGSSDVTDETSDTASVSAEQTEASEEISEEPEESDEAEETSAAAEEQNTSTASERENKIVEELSPISWEYDDSDFEVQRVGDAELGYIDIPADWTYDEDLAALAEMANSAPPMVYESPFYEADGIEKMDIMSIESVYSSMLQLDMSETLNNLEMDNDVKEICVRNRDINGMRASSVIGLRSDRYTVKTYVAAEDESGQCVIRRVTIDSNNPKVVDLIETYSFSADTSETEPAAE